MKALRILLALLLIALAVPPFAFHFAYAGLWIAKHLGRNYAALNLAGSVMWMWVCWCLWPTPRAGVTLEAFE